MKTSTTTGSTIGPEEREHTLPGWEERYRTYAEVTGQLAWVTNADGEVEEDAPLWRKYTGRSFEEIKGRGWLASIHPDDAERVARAWKEAVATRTPYEIACRLRRHDGAYRHFLARAVPLLKEDGTVREWVGTCLDITARTKAEEKVVQLAAIVESSDDAIIGLTLEGIVTSWNRGAEKTYGFRESEIIGMPFSRLVPPGRENELPQILGRIKAGEHIERYETVRRRKDGVDIHMSLIVSPVTDRDGRIVGASSIGRDITAAKKAEEALLTSRLHLSEAMDLARTVYWERDPLTGNFVFNDPFYAFYGTTAEREGGYMMTGEEYARRFIHPDDAHLLREAVKKRDSAEGLEFVNDVEHRIVRRDGEVRHILARIRATRDETGRLVRCYGANQDITERTRSEETLKASEKQYRELAESLPRPIFEADASGRITYANRRAYESTGYAPEDILEGLSLFQVVMPEARATAHSKKLLAGERLRGSEYAVRRKNGSSFPALVYASPIEKDGAVTGIRGVIFDISEKKAHEEALQASRLQLEEAADLARIAYWEQDEATGEFIFNEPFYDLYGTTAEREGGFRMTPEEYGRRFVHQDDLDEFRRRIAARGTRPPSPDLVQHEHRAVRRDGDVIYVLVRHRAVMDPHGRIVKTVGVHQDITARRTMEDALRESETKLRAVFDGSRDAIAVSKDGIRIFANPAFVALLGYGSADEVTGRPVLDSIAPESRDFVEDLARKRLRGEPVPPLYEQTMVRKDGTKLFTEVSISTYMLKGEEFWCAVLRDITEKKRLEGQLRQSQKLEAVGTLAGGIAHDFNNILTAMIGFTQLAKDRAFRGSIQAGYLQRVVDAGMRGRDLVKQMLAFSRNTGQEREPLHLGSLVKEAMKLIRASIPSTVRVKMRVENDSGLVLADPTQMEQILMNLCMNGAHAMREKGGVLEVGLTEFDRLEDVKGDGMKPGPYMRLTVRDTGVGMPPEIVEKVFDPFFTTKKPTEGTGLGLFVVHGIVRRHDGYLTTESEPGKGSTFTVFLPKVGEGHPKKAHGKEVIPVGHERVLFVDDEEALTHVGRDMLQKLGYDVTVTNDATEALELFRADPSRFDLVITDQTMPGLTGVELFAQLRSIRDDVPVILTTGYSDLVEASSAKREGIAGFVMKPFTKGELARAVRKVLDG